MEKFIRIITCSTEIKKPSPPPRESLKKKISENHYVLGPTQSTAGTPKDYAVYAVNADLVPDENDAELYMDLSTLSNTNLLPATETTVTPIPPPRAINARKVAKMIPTVDKGSEFSHIPEERKAKLLNSLKNRLKKNKTNEN